ncbi:hypothetical protein TcasGA2_TC031652 [Tribolium castaneum]|uniref:Uncharacterized protein n=1 Tax=Tribolium castaneum TaxID=7070 RepID=A0A139W8E5_TRICA|nr:hypothetical protein TcasGA2_TC031652 [Tribolium castaneum]
MFLYLLILFDLLYILQYTCFHICGFQDFCKWSDNTFG